MVDFKEYEKTFKKGTILEVSSEEKGLRGSWYTATVIRSISRKTHKILVEYHNLLAEGGGSKPLREFVDAILVRPVPRRDDPNRLFRVMEDVDAFHNDGWWEGVVTQVHNHHSNTDSNDNNNNVDDNKQDDDVVEGSGRVYSVFFRCSREQIDFTASNLRLHREWVRGNEWVPPLEQHHVGSPSSGLKRKNGEDREDERNGGRHRVTKTGVGKDVGRGTRCTPRKQAGRVVNGRGREQTRGVNRLDSNGVVARKRQRISSNGTHSNGGVNRNGKLQEPRRGASNHVGRRSSRK